jgi:GTP cyclohydrolase II
MSIRIASPPSSSLALMREARSVFARSLGFAVAAIPVPVLGGAVGTVPAVTGLMLFTGLLIALESRIAAYHPHPRLGWANRITLVRAGIACLIAARALDPAPLGAPERWLLVAIAGTALLLDGADGWAARRQRLASAFGARFDMEVDAFAVLVLAVTVVKAAAVPYWVLAIGTMRYLYIAAGRVLPVLRRAPPTSPFADRRRKTIAVVQSVALLIALAPSTSPSWAATTCATALGLLAYSFAGDIVMLLSAWPYSRGRISLPAQRSARHMMRGGKEKRVREPRTLTKEAPGGASASQPNAGRALGEAITALRRGEPVLIRDDEISVLAVAAELVTDENLHRLREISRAPARVVLTRRRAVALGLAPREELSGALTISVSSELPAAVIRNLADPGASLGAEPPGFGPEPVVAKGGALAAVALAKLASLLPAALVLRIGTGVAAPLARHGNLAIIEAAAVFKRGAAATGLERVAEARVPLADAENARLIAFRPRDGGLEHLAIMIGSPDPARPVLVRLHSECFTGDLLASLRCDCGDQLRGAIAAISRTGGGVLLYLAQEGRGIGLVNKLRAYRLQDAGFDTLDANEQLGFDADERVYLPAAEMLRQLGFGTIRLLTNNPDKVAALERYGIRIAERVPHVFPSNGHNERYLRTKATRSGHFL